MPISVSCDWKIAMTLLETRKQFKLSQKEAASIAGVPLRTFLRYEKDEEYGSRIKRNAMTTALAAAGAITETKGLLSIDRIKDLVRDVFDSVYPGQIEFCYLFGSYAKGYAKESSDVDLCVSTSLSGLRFAGLSESIRAVLHKKIDLIRLSNLEGNFEMVNEIMKDGVKIYG